MYHIQSTRDGKRWANTADKPFQTHEDAERVCMQKAQDPDEVGAAFRIVETEEESA